MSSVFLPPKQTRLVTIAAHVDHGKTTLADNLIEANGIISERLAGTLRYLDSDPEEQRRGITMRSSAIGLQHVYQATPKSDPTKMVVHLYDSPGHTDFSYEVSSALSACDSVLLVVDAVEGMGPRTHQVFRESFQNQLIPILVVNKLDRLCLDLGLTATEAYLRLRGLLETVNAAASAMLTSAHNVVDEHDESLTEKIEQLWTFDAAKGNVVFVSALFGFGFTSQNLARALFKAGTLPIKPPILRACMFSDSKLKDGKLLKWKAGSADLPLFAEYGLQPLWSILEAVAGAAVAAGLASTLFAEGRIAGATQGSEAKDTKIKADTPGMDEVLAILQVGATGKDIPKTVEDLQKILSRTGANTEHSVVRSLLRRFRPLSDSILDTVCEYAPSPAESSALRTSALKLKLPVAATDEYEQVAAAVSMCDPSEDATTTAHVYKFMAVERSQVRDATFPDRDTSTLILGVARVLSGRLRTDGEYHVFGPKHTINETAPLRTVRLYLLMGSSFVKVDEVPAGHLCAVGNLEDVQLKSATLCSSPSGMPIQALEQGVRPLVKVNIEAEDANNTAALEKGLLKLSLADSAVEVTATAKGERHLACLGEIHLEQSLLDLQKAYCGQEIKLRISDPIVDFGETTDWFENEIDYPSFWKEQALQLRQMTVPPYNEEEGLSNAHNGRCRAILSGRSAAIHVRVIPLSQRVFASLQHGQIADDCADELLKLGAALGYAGRDAGDIFKSLDQAKCVVDSNGSVLMEGPALHRPGIVGIESSEGEVSKPPSVHEQKEPIEYEGEHSSPVSSSDEALARLKSNLINLASGTNENEAELDEAAGRIWRETMKGSVDAGFQLALRSGPVCEEPVRNILVVIEGVEVALVRSENGALEAAKSVSGGLVVSALRSGVRCALLSRPIRLMEGHLKLTLHSSMAGLGGLYSVLNKRRGKVLDDSMVDGADLLMITALIPQAEAFGLAPELYKITSGEVTAPELIFNHWDRLDLDPFWVPTSLEEREDFGELSMAGDSSTGIDNAALKYIRQVRKQKGLMLDSSRTVMNAEKQRTLKR